MIPPRYSELAGLFGEIDLKAGSWTKELDHMVFLHVPAILQNYLLFQAQDALHPSPVTRIYCNRMMSEPLGRAFASIIERKLYGYVYGYGGCFQIRNKRGSMNLSTHAWGMAIDINPNQNPLGINRGDSGMHRDLVSCFTEQGFVWGGHFQHPDLMHFQWVIPG